MKDNLHNFRPLAWTCAATLDSSQFISMFGWLGLQASLQGNHRQVQLCCKLSSLLLDLYSVAQMQLSWRRPLLDGSVAQLVLFHLQGDCERFLPRCTSIQPDVSHLLCGVNNKVTLLLIYFFLYFSMFPSNDEVFLPIMVFLWKLHAA